MRATTCLLVLTYISVGHGAVEYYGKFIGPLKNFHHGVSGDVYAVDARTLHIRDFNYDGEGPAAYFYVGNTKVVNANGHRLLDERGHPHPLKRYRGRHVTLTLPEGKTLAHVKWFAVWCDEAAVNFGDVKIPKNLDFPKPQKIASLSGVHGVSSEPIVVVDAQTLLIPSFSYDGEAPDAKFWVGRGPKPSPQGIRVPDENGKEVPLRRYDRKTIVLTLPGDLTVFQIGHFGVWCEAFTVDFGHVQVPPGLNVPPSLKMLGVSPQKRSRSLQLSALAPSQALHPGSQASYRQQPSFKQQFGDRDKNYNNNYNYQNVLPLFNVQETIRPTTYRPQLLIQPTTPDPRRFPAPSTVDPRILQGDHRFSQKQTHGYLPLQQQHHYAQTPRPLPSPTPSVQIIPSISLNEDNGLVLHNQFDLGPPQQPVFVDPNYYNQQLQYEQFRNQPFLINVQDDQFAYQRPIRKESDRPPANSIPKDNEPQQKQYNHQKEQKEKEVTPLLVRPQPQLQLQPEPFHIPLLPRGPGVSISPAILAEEFEHNPGQSQPQTRQALVPRPPEILTVPQFVNNGFFNSDFPVTSNFVQRPTTFGSTTASQTLRPVSRLPPKPIPPFRNNPEGSFSRFVLSSGSTLHDTLVRY